MNKVSKIVFAIIVIISIAFIIFYSLNKDNKNMETINKIVKTVKASNTEVMLYVGSSDCEACDLQGPQMSLLLSNYDFEYYYVDFNEISTTSGKTNFIKSLGVDTTVDFSTPNILIYKNGKIISQTSGLTSVNKIFDVLQENSIIENTEKMPVNYLTLTSFTELTEDNSEHVVMLGSAASEASNSAQEIIWNIAKEKNITIDYLMLNDLSETEGATFEKKLSYYSSGENTVTLPTMLIIKNGEVISVLADLQTSDSYIEFLTENGIIE